MGYLCTFIKRAKIQSTDNTNAGEDVKQRELSFIGGRKGTDTLEDSFAVSHKTRYFLPYKSAIMAPWYLPKRTENLYLHKILHTDVCSSFIYNCQNLEEINMSFNR